jgi:hypothetical protein
MSLELDTLLHELSCIEGCEHTKARVKHMLITLAGQRIYFAKRSLSRPLDVARVRGMVDAGMAGVDLCEAVMERLGVSTGAAYRLIREARKPLVKENLDLFKQAG